MIFVYLRDGNVNVMLLQEVGKIGFQKDPKIKASINNRGSCPILKCFHKGGVIDYLFGRVYFPVIGSIFMKVSFSGKLCCIGGGNVSVESYDPITGIITDLTETPNQSGFDSVYCDGVIYDIGKRIHYKNTESSPAIASPKRKKSTVADFRYKVDTCVMVLNCHSCSTLIKG